MSANDYRSTSNWPAITDSRQRVHNHGLDPVADVERLGIPPGRSQREARCRFVHGAKALYGRRPESAITRTGPGTGAVDRGVVRSDRVSKLLESGKSK